MRKFDYEVLESFRLWLVTWDFCITFDFQNPILTFPTHSIFTMLKNVQQISINFKGMSKNVKQSLKMSKIFCKFLKMSKTMSRNFKCQKMLQNMSRIIYKCQKKHVQKGAYVIYGCPIKAICKNFKRFLQLSHQTSAKI